MIQTPLTLVFNMQNLKNLLLLLLFLVPLAYAEQILQGSVVQQVQVDEARNAAFQNLPKQIDLSKYAQIDPDREANLRAQLEHKTCLPNRRLTFFGNGSYGVVYFGKKEGFYYNPQGRLYKVERFSVPATPESFASFPVRGAAYLVPQGVLETTRYTPAFAKDYSFNPDGSLKYYCVQTFCFNADGSVGQVRDISTNCGQPESSKPGQ
jgi:hypothetical protein